MKAIVMQEFQKKELMVNNDKEKKWIHGTIKYVQMFLHVNHLNVRTEHLYKSDKDRIRKFWHITVFYDCSAYCHVLNVSPKSHNELLPGVRFQIMLVATTSANISKLVFKGKCTYEECIQL